MSDNAAKTIDARLERLDELRNEFIGISYRICSDAAPFKYTHALMAADCSMKAAAEICTSLLELPAPPPQPESSPRRVRNAKSAKNPAWAKDVEGVIQ